MAHRAWHAARRRDALPLLATARRRRHARRASRADAALALRRDAPLRRGVPHDSHAALLRGRPRPARGGRERNAADPRARAWQHPRTARLARAVPTRTCNAARARPDATHPDRVRLLCLRTPRILVGLPALRHARSLARRAAHLLSQRAPTGARRKSSCALAARRPRVKETLIYPCIVNPPDTLIVCPVMNSASSLARNSTAPAMSSGLPRRPIGTARR